MLSRTLKELGAEFAVGALESREYRGVRGKPPPGSDRMGTRLCAERAAISA